MDPSPHSCMGLLGMPYMNVGKDPFSFPMIFSWDTHTHTQKNNKRETTSIKIYIEKNYLTLYEYRINIYFYNNSNNLIQSHNLAKCQIIV